MDRLTTSSRPLQGTAKMDFGAMPATSRTSASWDPKGRTLLKRLRVSRKEIMGASRKRSHNGTWKVGWGGLILISFGPERVLFRPWAVGPPADLATAFGGGPGRVSTLREAVHRYASAQPLDFLAPFGAALGNPEMEGRQTVRARTKNASFPNRNLAERRVLLRGFRRDIVKNVERGQSRAPKVHPMESGLLFLKTAGALG